MQARIIRQTRRRRRGGWFAALLGVLAGAALLLLIAAPQRTEAPTAQPAARPPVPAATASPFGRGPAVLGPDAESAALPAQPSVPPMASLPSISYQELRQLKDTLGQGPDAGGEFARTAAFMIFSDAVQRLRQLHAEGGDAAEMLALARLVDDGLPQQMSQGELSAADARLVKALVLNVLEPDPLQRPTALARWQAQNAQRGVEVPKR